MKAVRLVNLRVQDTEGRVWSAKVDVTQIIKFAEGLKLKGWKLSLKSILVSATIVQGNTSVIKNCA